MRSIIEVRENVFFSMYGRSYHIFNKAAYQMSTADLVHG